MIEQIRRMSKLHLLGLAGSYSIIFFSMNRVLAVFLLLACFVSPVSGFISLMSVLFTNLLAWLIGLPDSKTRAGMYGFNALLTSLALTSMFATGTAFYLLLPVALMITLLFTVWLDGRLSKLNLPFLSLPFVFALWLILLAWVFESETINRSILMNLTPASPADLPSFVIQIESYIRHLVPETIEYYFTGLASIFFSSSVLAGALMAAGLLVFSRITFLLSLLGFFSAYFYYQFTGVPVNGENIMQFGFNFILTAIAIGGFYYIPSAGSFLMSILAVPILSVLFSASAQVLFKFGLSPFSLPFNLMVMFILYMMMFREKHFSWLKPALVQTFSPENNLYGHQNDMFRFGRFVLPISLPVIGTWKITQGHNGNETHRDEYRHAWDFQIEGENQAVFSNEGRYLKDYYCFDKPVYVPADGIVEEVISDIPDNEIGQINQVHNWGNTLVIRHSPYLFSKLSHLREQSIQLKKGDVVKKGYLAGRVGNSGRSPFPHLHFQLQSTPFIGSRTLSFPLSSFYVHEDADMRFVEQGIPEEGQKVSALLPDEQMKRIFHLVPGMEIRITSSNNHKQFEKTTWQVLSDMSNQYYIRCTETGAVAYFTVRNDVFYFLSYYGKRKALLYKFYTGFHKIITGIEKSAITHDRIPVNMGKFRVFLWLQDFVAPFFRFIKIQYSVHSEKIQNDALSESIDIDSHVIQKVAGVKFWEMKSSMKIHQNTEMSVVFEEKQSRTAIQCSITYGY